MDEETIQRLLDGELSAASRRSAEAHLDECPRCLEALREAGREEAFISSFFRPQLFVAVPTERLWAKLRRALAVDNPAARCV